MTLDDTLVSPRPSPFLLPLSSPSLLPREVVASPETNHSLTAAAADDERCLSAAAGSSSLQQQLSAMTVCDNAQRLGVQLSPVPGKLVLCKVAKENLAGCTHLLMRMMFFADKRNRFFSYASDDEEVTFICDSAWIPEFPDGLVTQEPGTWTAIHLGLGAGGFDPGAVNVLTAPLAAAGIHVLYVSTFSSDYVLVRSDRLQDALALLCACKAPAFDVSVDERHSPASSSSDGGDSSVASSSLDSRLSMLDSLGQTGA